MSVHLGLHWNAISATMNRIVRKNVSTGKTRILFRMIAAVICLYGIYAFMNRELATYLFLRSEYVFFDFSRPLLIFFIDYIAIMILFACIGNLLGILCKTKSR